MNFIFAKKFIQSKIVFEHLYCSIIIFLILVFFVVNCLCCRFRMLYALCALYCCQNGWILKSLILQKDYLLLRIYFFSSRGVPNFWGDTPTFGESTPTFGGITPISWEVFK